MHAGAVVAEEGLGHEGGDLAVVAGHVLDDVLVGHDLVGHAHQAVEAHVDLGLAGGGHLVVVLLDVDAHLVQLLHHGGADVLLGVGGRHREIPLLVAGLVAEVEFAVQRALGAAVPRALVGVDEVVAAVGVLVKADGVEDEELELRAPEADVGDARLLEEGLRFLGDVAGVATVGAAGARVDDVAGHGDGGVGEEGVDERRRGVWHDEHVALFDGLEAANGGAVEAGALGEQLLVELHQGHGEVLPGADQVAEAQVDHSGPALLDHLDDVRGGLGPIVTACHRTAPCASYAAAGGPCCVTSFHSKTACRSRCI